MVQKQHEQQRVKILSKSRMRWLILITGTDFGVNDVAMTSQLKKKNICVSWILFTIIFCLFGIPIIKINNCGINFCLDTDIFEHKGLNIWQQTYIDTHRERIQGIYK